jgi:hypothetical protein
MRTMAARLHAHAVILVHSEAAPAQAEWDAYVGQLRSLEQVVGGDLSRGALIVFTDGGAPNASQRRQVNEWLRGRYWPVSVVSFSGVVRAVGTAMSFFNKGLEIYSPLAWRDAFAHALVKPAQVDEVRRLVEDLSRGLGGTHTVAAAFDDARQSHTA